MNRDTSKFTIESWTMEERKRQEVGIERRVIAIAILGLMDCKQNDRMR